MATAFTDRSSRIRLTMLPTQTRSKGTGVPFPFPRRTAERIEWDFVRLELRASSDATFLAFEIEGRSLSGAASRQPAHREAAEDRRGATVASVLYWQTAVDQDLRALRQALEDRSRTSPWAGKLRESLKGLERTASDAGDEDLATVALMLRYVLHSEPIEELEPAEWSGYFEAATEALRTTPYRANRQACSERLRRAGLSWVAMGHQPSPAHELRSSDEAGD